MLNSGGEVVTSDDWGTRRMAYEIDHRPEADYRLYQFNGDNALLDRLNQRLRIMDGVLRYRIIKVKPGQPVPPPPDQQAPRRREDREAQDTKVAARAAADAPPTDEDVAPGSGGAPPVAEGAAPAVEALRRPPRTLLRSRTLRRPPRPRRPWPTMLRPRRATRTPPPRTAPASSAGRTASGPVTCVTGQRKTPLFSALSWERAPDRSGCVCTLDRRSSSSTGGKQPHGSDQHQPGRTHRESDPRPRAPAHERWHGGLQPAGGQQHPPQGPVDRRMGRQAQLLRRHRLGLSRARTAPSTSRRAGRSRSTGASSGASGRTRTATSGSR